MISHLYDLIEYSLIKLWIIMKIECFIMILLTC